MESDRSAIEQVPAPLVGPGLHAAFEELRAAVLDEPYPSVVRRRLWLTSLLAAIETNRGALVAALDADYRGRAHHDSLLGDLLPTQSQIRHCLRHVGRWMAPQRRRSGWLLWPSRVSVCFRPKGVVGIMVPWNYPIYLSVVPLANALAAGNRAMIKLPEWTPNTNAVLKGMLADALGPSVVAVMTGGLHEARAFSAMPFDHLLFTGSAAVGRQVMAAAAANLVPVTLELGGKSPVVIGPDMPVAEAAARILWGKCLNAGQTCIAPDYVLCPQAMILALKQALMDGFNRRYPETSRNPDWSSIIHPQRVNHLQALANDAVNKGAQVCACQGPDGAESHRMSLHLITGVHPDMRVMQEEIFGPLLPLVPYEDVCHAMDWMARQPNPLALYVLSRDQTFVAEICERVSAGGVTINDTLLHVGADDAPFGGIGSSGMGAYHGRDGFLTFSHAQTIVSRRGPATSSLLSAPYGRWWQTLLLRLFMR